MPVGKIISLTPEKGFGFIKPTEAGGDVFFHKSVLACPLDTVKVGQEVEFELDSTAEKARAKWVTLRGRVGSQHDPTRGRSSTDKHRSSAGTRPSPAAQKTECGFVTKLVWKKKQGFISADSGGGTEI